jgi:hypothetical protein
VALCAVPHRWQRKFLTAWRTTLEETRAWVNFEVIEVLHQRWVSFGHFRQRSEKSSERDGNYRHHDPAFRVRRSRLPRRLNSECLGHFWRARLGQFWRAPKARWLCLHFKRLQRSTSSWVNSSVTFRLSHHFQFRKRIASGLSSSFHPCFRAMSLTYCLSLFNSSFGSRLRGLFGRSTEVDSTIFRHAVLSTPVGRISACRFLPDSRGLPRLS